MLACFLQTMGSEYKAEIYKTWFPVAMVSSMGYILGLCADAENCKIPNKQGFMKELDR